EIAQGDRVAVDSFTQRPLAPAPALGTLVEEDDNTVALRQRPRAARAEPFRYCNQVEQAIAVPVHRADSARGKAGGFQARAGIFKAALPVAGQHKQAVEMDGQ